MSTTAWDEYSDHSDDNTTVTPISSNQNIINEATTLLFLRKYSHVDIPKETLIQIFIQCNYDDTLILKQLEQTVKTKGSSYTIVQNPFLKSSKQQSSNSSSLNAKNMNNNFKRDKYSFNNNNKNKSFKCIKKGNYYKKYKKGSKNYYEDVNYNSGKYNTYKKYRYEDDNDNENENKTEIINNNNNKGEDVLEKLGEVELSSQQSEETTTTSAMSQSQEKEETCLEVRKYRSCESMGGGSYVKGANFVRKKMIKGEDEQVQGFPSRLFPGVYFTMPIKNKINENNNNNNSNKFWERVMEYYSINGKFVKAEQNIEKELN